MADHFGPQRLWEKSTEQRDVMRKDFRSGKSYCDVSMLNNFGPCLIWNRSSTVSQIQPE